MTIRIGNGFDVHALVAGRKLVLGGVTIAHDRGLDGHSDADVLLHAIADAMLGALALGDIGAHFPDADPRWKDADSRVLLRHVAALAAAQGFVIENLDTTVIAQAPQACAARTANAQEHRRGSGVRRRASEHQGDDHRTPGVRRSRGRHRRARDGAPVRALRCLTSRAGPPPARSSRHRRAP